MTQMTLSLSDELAAKLQARATESGHADVEAYVEDILRNYIQVLDLGRPPGILSDDDPGIEAELERRLNDPTPLIEATPAFWKDLKERARQRRENRQP
jgi:hypothetical protein